MIGKRSFVQIRNCYSHVPAARNGLDEGWQSETHCSQVDGRWFIQHWRCCSAWLDGAELPLKDQVQDKLWDPAVHKHDKQHLYLDVLIIHSAWYVVYFPPGKSLLPVIHILVTWNTWLVKGMVGSVVVVVVLHFHEMNTDIMGRNLCLPCLTVQFCTSLSTYNPIKFWNRLQISKCLSQ